MGKYLFRLIILGLFLPAMTSVFSQDITLFTKSDCANCKYTKAILNDNSITYAEYDLANNNHANRMLYQLKHDQYEGAIHLPVIYLNDSLIYPSSASLESSIHFILNDSTCRLLINKESCQYVMPSYCIVAEYSTDTLEKQYILDNFTTMGYHNTGYFFENEHYYYFIDSFHEYTDASNFLMYHKAFFERLFIKEHKK